mmetsp:Transcript_1234/g.1483  ORF Transcript_1234/g.1483 Transcript_1234/m.1483 type:complete len:279 (-) Transcript_1234:181-1017(-)
MRKHHLLNLHSLILGAASAHSFSPTTAFQNFVFSPNGVCVSPSTFYLADVDDNVKDCNDNNSPITTNLGQKKLFSMRNVPGEGDCMFQAVALATAASMGLGANNALLRAISEETRDVVAQVMGSRDGNLHIEGQRLVRTSDLLTSASRSEGMSPDEYLERLKKSGSDGGLYGGGPELTVLSNLLRRPISIYELEDDTTTTTTTAENNNNTNGESKYCRIKLAGVFGDHFKDPCLSIPNSAILSGLQPGAYSWHLHILVVDAGFEKHACALLPKFCDLP